MMARFFEMGSSTNDIRPLIECSLGWLFALPPLGLADILTEVLTLGI